MNCYFKNYHNSNFTANGYFGPFLEYVNPNKFSIPTEPENGSSPSNLAETLVLKNSNQ